MYDKEYKHAKVHSTESNTQFSQVQLIICDIFY